MKKKRVAAKKPTKKTKTKKRPVVFSDSTDAGPPVVTGDNRLREQQAALGAMAKAMIAGLDAQDQRDWEINKKYDNEPMVPGSAEWHVHQH